MRVNSIWTTFLAHNIPTSLGANPTFAPVMVAAISTVYPTVAFAHTPRRLNTNTVRIPKTHSMMVKILSSSATMVSLVIKLIPLFNAVGRLSIYRPIQNPTPIH